MSEFLETGSKLTTIQRKHDVMDLPPEQLKPIISWKEVVLLSGAAIVAGVIFWFFLAVGLSL